MGILDKINEKALESTGQVNNTVLTNNYNDEDEDKPNILLATVFSIIGIVASIALFICLATAFSYDLCIMLDNSYLYIAGVLAVLMAIGIYTSLRAIKEKVIVSPLSRRRLYPLSGISEPV